MTDSRDTSSSLRILVLRPGEVGARLAELLSALGADAMHAPSLSIEPKVYQLSEQAHYHASIFISPTSVLHAQQNLTNIRNTSDEIIAVGSGTAEALKQLGIKDVKVPARFNSEGLLAMPELVDVKGKHILLIKGIGGRTLLADTLSERGATCEAVDVYKRVPAPIQRATWDWFNHRDVKTIVTCASVETLTEFEMQRTNEQCIRPHLLLVGSDRIAELANALGYTNTITVGGAANHYFVNAVEKELTL